MEPIFNKYRGEEVLGELRSVQNSEFTQSQTVIHSFLQQIFTTHL